MGVDGAEEGGLTPPTMRLSGARDLQIINHFCLATQRC